MKRTKREHEAIDRLKSMVRNPRGWGDYGCWTDALGLFNEDVQALEALVILQDYLKEEKDKNGVTKET